jgi:hypothetical protein
MASVDERREKDRRAFAVIGVTMPVYKLKALARSVLSVLVAAFFSTTVRCG